MEAHSQSSIPEFRSGTAHQGLTPSFFTPAVSTWLEPLSPLAREYYWTLIDAQKWSLFAAGTFRRRCSPKRAESAALWWLRLVTTRALGARQGHKKLLPSVVFVEKTEESHHDHFLVAGCDHLTRHDLDELRDAWVERYGSRDGMDVRRFSYELGGLNYVLKDVREEENTIVIPYLDLQERMTDAL